MTRVNHAQWMTNTLKAAAIYNLVFALMTLVAPFWIFDVTGATRPNFPELWQCIGMIVGVYGIGYWIAAFDPYRHWPVIFVGWLGKTFGPLGFAKALWEGVFPLQFGWIIVFNDLIWWLPFAVIVKEALTRIMKPQWGEITEASRKTFAGFSESSKTNPLLVVFLRHSGCTFCREMIADLKTNREELKKSKLSLVLVHMGLTGIQFPNDWKSILDEDRALYRLAGLEQGKWRQVVSPSVLRRGFVAGILNGHGVGMLEGDGMMMPGAQLWRGGQLVFSWKAKSVADRLPFSEILNFTEQQ